MSIDSLIKEIDQRHQSLKKLNNRRFKPFFRIRAINYLCFLNEISLLNGDLCDFDGLPEPEKSQKTALYFSVMHNRNYWRSELYRQGYFTKLNYD